MPALMVRLTRKSGPLSEDGGDEDLLEHKAVARSLSALDALASGLALPPLSAFLSEDPDNVADLVDDEDEAEAILAKLPPVRWFPPAEALPTVTALLARVEGGDPVPALKSPDKVAADLRDLLAILQHAAAKHATFRF